MGKTLARITYSPADSEVTVITGDELGWVLAEESRQLEEEVSQMDDLMGYKLTQIEQTIEECSDDCELNDLEFDSLITFVRDQCEYARLKSHAQDLLEKLKEQM